MERAAEFFNHDEHRLALMTERDTAGSRSGEPLMNAKDAH